MSAEPLRVYLERVDLAANVRRFYYAFVGPTFCGPVCVVRARGAPDGRLGVWQRTLSPLVFSDEVEAAKWLDRQRRAQRATELRRGYVAPVTVAENSG